jgi:hypothetical protein
MTTDGHPSWNKRRIAMKQISKSILSSCSVLFLLAGLSVSGLVHGMVNETEYSTSLSEAAGIVRIIVAAFGGIIGVLGIVVTLKGVGDTADVSMSVAEHKSLSMKRVSQGVVITLIGAAILIGALYLLPEKKTERQIKGEEIRIERKDGEETLYLEQRTMQ